MKYKVTDIYLTNCNVICFKFTSIMDEILQCEIRNLWNVLQTRLNCGWGGCCCCCCCWVCSLVANANRPPGWAVNGVAAGGVYDAATPAATVLPYTSNCDPSINTSGENRPWLSGNTAVFLSSVKNIVSA